jgi:hypothetical protein
VPNIRFLVQTLTPIPGSGSSSGGIVISGGGAVSLGGLVDGGDVLWGGVIVRFPRVQLPDGGPIVVGATYVANVDLH